MVHPQESKRIGTLYAAGAHVKVLARAFARDERTVEATLGREGIELRHEPPPRADWRSELALDSLTTIQGYFTKLQVREEQAWQEINRVAHEQPGQDYVFESQSDYDAVMSVVQPPEPVESFAARHDIDLNYVLLAYAEWRDEAER